MSIDAQVQALAIRAATQDKKLLTLINGNVNDLTSLTTTQKANLVGAINEVVAKVAAIINDITPGTTTTYSSSKINTAISQAVAQAKSDILGGAGPAYDTLQELRDLLSASDSADHAAIDAINTALGNRVRFDAPQTLTAPQAQQARDNIGAVSAAAVGSTTTDYVAIYESYLT